MGFQMPVRSMTLTTSISFLEGCFEFQMPVRSMTLTTSISSRHDNMSFQMPVRSMTLTTIPPTKGTTVSDACQINDFDH